VHTANKYSSLQPAFCQHGEAGFLIACNNLQNGAGELPFRCEIILKVRKYLQFNHHNIKGDPNNEPEQ
jgi:hypothetical protein